jgi:hypothetical protein
MLLDITKETNKLDIRQWEIFWLKQGGEGDIPG